MGTKHTCLRCGYEVKELVAVDEQEQKRRERETVKVIDPENTYLTDEFGNSTDEDAYMSDPFGSIFGDLFGFDPIGDLLGGLFGFSTRPTSRVQTIMEEPEEEKAPNVVEVKKVEIFDEDGNPVKKESKVKQAADKVKQKVKSAVHKKGGDKADDK